MNVSAELAQQLKEAGLTWKPTLHDFFAVPDTAVSDRMFVLADMMAGMEVLQGYRAITFNGATEWALDYVLMMDALWIPSEAQARQMAEQRLGDSGRMALFCNQDGYVCELQIAEEPLSFSAPTAADAYGQALLFFLNQTR